MTSMVGLPSELVENIVHYINDETFFALRLTCKDLNVKSVHFFSKKFFTTRRVCVSLKSSLQALIDVSKHELFSHCVQVLRFGTEHLVRDGHLHIPFHCDDKLPALGDLMRLYQTDVERKNRYLCRMDKYRTYYSEQKHIKDTDTDRIMLKEALLHLKRCHTIQMCNFRSSLDHRHTFTDRIFLEQTGVGLSTCVEIHDTEQVIGRTFCMLVGLVTEFNLPITSLEARLFGLSAGLCLSPDRLRHFSSQPACLGIRVLKLHVGQSSVWPTTLMIDTLVPMFPNLRHLDLDFLQDAFWLRTCASITNHTVVSPSLEILGIHHLRTTPAALFDFTRGLEPNLQRIELTEVCLLGSWKDAFDELAQLPALESIYLSSLKEDRLEGRAKDVPLLTKDEHPDQLCSRFYQLEHKGADIGELLSKIASNMDLPLVKALLRSQDQVMVF